MADIATMIIDEVFDRLSENGMFTVPEIVTATGLSMTTVSKYVSSMLENGILEPKDTAKSGMRGRQAILYGVKGEANHLLGVDVRYDSLIMSLMDLAGNVLMEDVARDFSYDNTNDCLARMCSLVELFVREAKEKLGGEIVQMCLILGGRVNSSLGTSATNFNVEWLGDNSLEAFLEDRLGFGVRIENDAKAMAYGEYLKIGDPNLRNMLYINVGWGLGLGLILDGKIYYGRDGYSGELGHIQVYDNDVMCHCGKVGCLETEVSGRALQRKIVEGITAGRSSVLAGGYRKTGRIGIADIMCAAQKEDPMCVELVTNAGTELGKHVSSLINIFNPERIVIGGAIARAAAYYFLYPIKAAVRKYSLRLMSRDVVIDSAILGENAGVFGACMIARKVYYERISARVIEGL